MKVLRSSTGHTKARQRFPKQEPRINTPRPGGEREEVELPNPGARVIWRELTPDLQAGTNKKTDCARNITQGREDRGGEIL